MPSRSNFLIKLRICALVSISPFSILAIACPIGPSSISASALFRIASSAASSAASISASVSGVGVACVGFFTAGVSNMPSGASTSVSTSPFGGGNSSSIDGVVSSGVGASAGASAVSAGGVDVSVGFGVKPASCSYSAASLGSSNPYKYIP